MNEAILLDWRNHGSSAYPGLKISGFPAGSEKLILGKSISSFFSHSKMEGKKTHDRAYKCTPERGRRFKFWRQSYFASVETSQFILGE